MKAWRSLSPRARRIGWAVLALGVVLGGLVALAVREAGDGDVAHLSGLSVRYWMTPGDFARTGPLRPDFGIGPGGEAFLLAEGKLVVAPGPGSPPFAMAANPPLTSIAIGADNTPLVVAGDFLGKLREDGSVLSAAPLPYPDMRLAAAAEPGSAYLFGPAQHGYRVYRAGSDGQLPPILQLDRPPVAVAESGGVIDVATPGEVLGLDKDGARLVFTAPRDPAFGIISSIALAGDGTLFVATPSHVFVVMGGNALSIVNDAGGFLRWRDGRLYVLDLRRQLLFALTPANAHMLENDR